MRREARKRGAKSGSATVDATAAPTIVLRLSDLPAWDRSLLELVLLDVSILARIQPRIEPAAMASDAGRQIYAAMCRLAADGWQSDFGRLLAVFDDPDMKNLLVQLDESCQTKTSADRQRWLADLLDSHRRRGEEAAHRHRLAAARQDVDNAEQLLAQFCEQSKSKHLSEYERRKK
jgi:replicative DNA helicase